MISRLEKQALKKQELEEKKWRKNFWKHLARSRYWKKKVIEMCRQRLAK